MKLYFTTKNLVEDIVFNIFEDDALRARLLLTKCENLVCAEVPLQGGILRLRLEGTQGCERAGLTETTIITGSEELLEDIYYEQLGVRQEYRKLFGEVMVDGSDYTAEEIDQIAEFVEKPGLKDVLGFQHAFETVVESADQAFEELYLKFSVLADSESTFVEVLGCRKNRDADLESFTGEQHLKLIASEENIKSHFKNVLQQFIMRWGAIAIVTGIAIWALNRLLDGYVWIFLLMIALLLTGPEVIKKAKSLREAHLVLKKSDCLNLKNVTRSVGMGVDLDAFDEKRKMGKGKKKRKQTNWPTIALIAISYLIGAGLIVLSAVQFIAGEILVKELVQTSAMSLLFIAGGSFFLYILLKKPPMKW